MLDHLILCRDPAHSTAYSCARCNEIYCMVCDHVSNGGSVKTIVRYCPDWRCQRERQIEAGERMGLFDIIRRAQALLNKDAEYVVIARGQSGELDPRSQAYEIRLHREGPYILCDARGWLGEQWSDWRDRRGWLGGAGFDIDDVLATDWRILSEA